MHVIYNLDKMGCFCEKRKPPQLIQYEIGNLNIPVSTKEIEFIIFKTSLNEIFRPDGFTREFYKM